MLVRRAVRSMFVLGLVACALCVPAATSTADDATPVNKAAVEYAERQAAVTAPKAQLEHQELAYRRRSATPPAVVVEPPTVVQSSAVASWRLWSSGLTGAILTGVVVMGAQHVRRRRGTA